MILNKKIVAFATVAALVLSAVSAYNPPVGAEDMCLLSSPKTLTGSVTSAGGALLSAGPDSIVVNPALTAKEQRVSLNVGYTFLFSPDDYLNESNTGCALQTGILIPVSMFVFSGYTNYTSARFGDMYLGRSINAKAGLAKEITSKLSVGLSVSGGYTWLYGTDWALGGNIGAMYDFGNLLFLEDVRLGASVLNIGKNYKDVLRLPIHLNKEMSAYPSLLTFKAGAAGTVLKNDVLELGMAIDFTTPLFQNLIVDFNTELEIKKMFVVSVAERFNVRESFNGYTNFIPTVGVFFRFTFGVKDNAYLESNGWSQSEMTVSAAYRNLYGTVHAMSAGADLNLGMKDTEAPEINVW